MIKFKSMCQEIPYSIFKKKYREALNLGQKNVEAIAISSYNKEKKEVDSRFVNLKIIDDRNFIFFSNYNSPKSIAFKSNDQISALLFWSTSNVQIRIKAKINKTSLEFNHSYFKKRSRDKNALAISSDQSKKIQSYDHVLMKYKNIKENKDLLECPNYWGGFSFIPYYFEFWEGHESRINKRTAFKRFNGDWKQYILEP
ncbi:pyridoxamine 5'-phosphate oxidase family protein [Gammaproteobacteria bacterium]|nr:pyridoxamine 5'-phosphate oxidase family protein [Gammaproteobacteria bacterium]